MNTAHTLVHCIAHWADQQPDMVAISGTEGGQSRSWTWAQYLAAVREVGRGLLALGLEPGECVAIVGANRPAWVICEFGIMAVRAIPAPIYTTSTQEQVAYIVGHSQARIGICDTAAQRDRLLACQGPTGRLEWVVVMDEIASDDPRVLTLSELVERGRSMPEDRLDERLDALTDTETALLIYTSGTTGTPKAVELDHGQMLGVAAAIIDRVPPVGSERYRSVSYLPLCHVAEQLFTNFLHLSTGGEVVFCAELSQLKEHLLQTRPTIFLGVPRVWEKFQAALEARFAEASPTRRRLAQWAMRTELAAFEREVATGQPVGGPARWLARRLVISKILAGLGLDRLKGAATGSAPISIKTLRFFASIGIVVHEGYGMSETTGVATCVQYGRPGFGNVGPPLKGVELRIAPDGEVLLRGRTMTRGYLRDPEKTAELLDADGWLHTGDLGELNADGCLRITGRKKDILITAGGKNVAPAQMEGLIQPIVGVGQVVVVGDRQPYLAALVTVDPDALAQVNELLGTQVASVRELAEHTGFLAHLTERIEADCNQKVARYQTIKRFRVLQVGFTVEGGHVTPTMKIKRNVVSKVFADEILALYASP